LWVAIRGKEEALRLLSDRWSPSFFCFFIRLSPPTLASSLSLTTIEIATRGKMCFHFLSRLTWLWRPYYQVSTWC
jgi:hypothetical protein